MQCYECSVWCHAHCVGTHGRLDHLAAYADERAKVDEVVRAREKALRSGGRGRARASPAGERDERGGGAPPELVEPFSLARAAGKLRFRCARCICPSPILPPSVPRGALASDVSTDESADDRDEDAPLHEAPDERTAGSRTGAPRSRASLARALVALPPRAQGQGSSAPAGDARALPPASQAGERGARRRAALSNGAESDMSDEDVRAKNYGEPLARGEAWPKRLSCRCVARTCLLAYSRWGRQNGERAVVCAGCGSRMHSRCAAAEARARLERQGARDADAGGGGSGSGGHTLAAAVAAAAVGTMPAEPPIPPIVCPTCDASSESARASDSLSREGDGDAASNSGSADAVDDDGDGGSAGCDDDDKDNDDDDEGAGPNGGAAAADAARHPPRPQPSARVTPSHRACGLCWQCAHAGTYGECARNESGDYRGAVLLVPIDELRPGGLARALWGAEAAELLLASIAPSHPSHPNPPVALAERSRPYAERVGDMRERYPPALLPSVCPAAVLRAIVHGEGGAQAGGAVARVTRGSARHHPASIGRGSTRAANSLPRSETVSRPIDRRQILWAFFDSGAMLQLSEAELLPFTRSRISDVLCPSPAVRHLNVLTADERRTYCPPPPQLLARLVRREQYFARIVVRPVTKWQGARTRARAHARTRARSRRRARVSPYHRAPWRDAHAPTVSAVASRAHGVCPPSLASFGRQRSRHASRAGAARAVPLPSPARARGQATRRSKCSAPSGRAGGTPPKMARAARRGARASATLIGSLSARCSARTGAQRCGARRHSARRPSARASSTCRLT